MLQTSVIIISLLVLNPILDYRQIKNNIYIDHFENLLLFSNAYLTTFVISYALKWMDLSEIFAFAVFIPAFRWILHDLLLNNLRGLPLNYLPKPGPNASKIDMLILKTGVSPFVIKLLSLFLSLYFSIKIL